MKAAKGIAENVKNILAQSKSLTSDIPSYMDINLNLGSFITV